MTLRRWLPGLALGLVVAVALALAAGSGSGDADGSPEARARRLASGLRCPVCQGLSVADSPSSTARAIADDIRRRIEAGQSDGEIRQAYVDSYGEWVLLEPPGRGLGSLVWVLPVAGLILATGALALAFRRWRRDPAGAPTDEDRDLVERALEERR